MLSENVKKFRKDKEITKAQLAELSNLSCRSIYFIESGQIQNPKLDTLTALANALGVSIAELTS